MGPWLSHEEPATSLGSPSPCNSPLLVPLGRAEWVLTPPHRCQPGEMLALLLLYLCELYPTRQLHSRRLLLPWETLTLHPHCPLLYPRYPSWLDHLGHADRVLSHLLFRANSSIPGMADGWLCYHIYHGARSLFGSGARMITMTSLPQSEDRKPMPSTTTMPGVRQT
jgi:hypothetical protein